MKRHNCKNKGIALISVLWVIVLLMVTAGSLTMSTRNEARMVRNIIDIAEARAAAEGGFYLAVEKIMGSTVQATWPADGSVQKIRIGNVDVQVAIQDEAGLIDLNTVKEEVLNNLLRNAEVEEDRRVQLVDAILDWRDEDDFRRLNGAEDDEYSAAGLDYPVKNAKFDSVDELQLVLGMDNDLYLKIKPALTVYFSHTGINPSIAPKQVLETTPGLDNDWIDNLAESKDRNMAERSVAADFPITAKGYLTTVKGISYAIKSNAKTASGLGAGVTGTITLKKGRTDTPYEILNWRVGVSTLEN